MKTAIHVETLSRIAYLRMSGYSLPKIADQLNAEGYKTAQGGAWYPSTVQLYCKVAAQRLTHPTGGAERRPVAPPPTVPAVSSKSSKVRQRTISRPRASQRIFHASPEVLNAKRAPRLIKNLAA